MQWLRWFLTCFVWLQVLGLITTIYLHRGVTHHAIKMKPGFAGFMRTLLWLGTDIVPKEWASVHRKHHAYADVDGDPHSPMIEGLPRVMLFNSMLYTREARNPVTLKQFGGDLPLTYKDIHRKQGMAIAMAGFVVLFTVLHGPWGILQGLLAPVLTMIMYIFMSACINGLAHAWGYKGDKETVAYNLKLLALFTGGEGLHNNHHWQKGNARFTQKWSEPDPGWWIIKVLARLRLVEIAHFQQMMIRQPRSKIAA